MTARTPERQNLHTHSRFSDGADTPEEIVISAINKGFTAIGFSEHAYTAYDSECCIKQDDIGAYFTEILRLKEKYSDQIEIFTGFECDSYHITDKTGLDFTIGSVHYIFNEESGEYLTIDYKPEMLEKARDTVAGGSMERLVRIYYDDLIRFVKSYKPDIVGHLDLIKKLNKGNRYFNPESAWYQCVIDDVAEKIAATGCIVEINTGGIFRGYVDEPYPSPEILSRMLELNVPVMISSDAHYASALDFWFDEVESLLKKIGYKSIKHLTSKGFKDVEI